MDELGRLDFIDNNLGLCQLPYQGGFVIMLSQQQYPSPHQHLSDHSLVREPRWEESPSDVTRQVGIPYVGISSHQSTSLLPDQLAEPLVSCHIKQEKQCYLEPQSDNKFCSGQDSIFANETIEYTNGQRCTETEKKDPVGKEINKKIAAFIQFLMTNRQPNDSFRSLYDNTEHPANVAALGEMRLNSVVKTESENELEERMEFAQNCMLKGVTKTAYVMDTLFKHVDKLPKELLPQQLMSDLNSAMKFFRAANLEFMQMRQGARKQYLKPNTGHDNPLIIQEDAGRIQNTSNTKIPTKISIHATRGSGGRTK